MSALDPVVSARPALSAHWARGDYRPDIFGPLDGADASARGITNEDLMITMVPPHPGKNDENLTPVNHCLCMDQICRLFVFLGIEPEYVGDGETTVIKAEHLRALRVLARAAMEEGVPL